MDNLNNNNEQQIERKPGLTNLSAVLLAVIFVLTLAVAICFKAVANFKDGIQVPVVIGYSIVVLLYIAVSLFDNFYRKDKKFIYRLVMSGLCLIADILFVLFFFI